MKTTFGPTLSVALLLASASAWAAKPSAPAQTPPEAKAPLTSTGTAPGAASGRLNKSSGGAVSNSSPFKTEPETSVDVDQIAFATGISSMTPVGESESFDSSVKSVFFWNRLRVHYPPTRIKHVWYLDGAKEAEFSLNLRYAHTRVWTQKNVRPGQWRVDITDENDRVIMTAAFPVRR